MAYFSCFCKIKFFFLRALSAYKFPVAICFARNTFPKAPLPNVEITSKLENVTLLLFVISFKSSASCYFLLPFAGYFYFYFAEFKTSFYLLHPIFSLLFFSSCLLAEP
jgi:hypothetical protein